MGLVLQAVRTCVGALAVGALSKGLDFSTDGKGHETVTYLAFYGVGAVFVLGVVVLTIVIQRRKKGGAMSSERESSSQSARAGRDAFAAGRDINYVAGEQSGDAAHRLRNEIAEIRRRLDELDHGNPAVVAFSWDANFEPLPTTAWQDCGHLLRSVLTSEQYAVIERAFHDIRWFNDNNGGVATISDSLATDSVRASLDQAEAVLP